MKVFCYLTEAARKWIDARLPEGWTYTIPSPELWGEKFKSRMREELSDSDFMLVGMQEISEELLKDCKHLKLLQRFGVGYDNIYTQWPDNTGVDRHLGNHPTNTTVQVPFGRRDSLLYP